MTLMNPELDEDKRAESVLAKLDATDEEAAKVAEASGPEAPKTEEIPAAEAKETAPAETPASAEGEGHSEPAEPAIEPPTTWKAELKDRWSKLPRDLQQELAQWETERNTGVNQRLEKSAAAERTALEAQKAIEARAQAAFQEQQNQIQALSALMMDSQLLDPLLVRGADNKYWLDLAQSDRDRYVTERAQYDVKVKALSDARQAMQLAQQQRMVQHLANEERALVQKVPEWSDNAVGLKALDGLRQHAVTAYGFRPDEVKVIADHRYVLMARDAARVPGLEKELAEVKAKLADKDKATAAALKAKQVQAPPAKVLKPGAAVDASEKLKSDRAAAAIKQARSTRSLSDKAAALASILE